MSRLRRENNDALNLLFQRPLRIVASGTLFLTHTLTVSSHPEPASVVRAHAVQRARGGSASTCLAIVAQFPNVNAILVAPLGGNEEGQMIIRDLENDRVSTRYCKVWESSGVPSAWILHAGESICSLGLDAVRLGLKLFWYVLGPDGGSGRSQNSPWDEAKGVGGPSLGQT